MNRVILMGRLTRDPEIRESANGKVARYTLAIDRRGRDKDAADYPQIVCFGRSAEWADQYLCKGKKILVTGRIQTSKYVNKQGVTIYNTDVVAEDQEFAESKGKESAQDEFVSLPNDAEMPFR